MEVFVYATPLALAALGETIGQRAGVLQIGLEGIMLSSALAAALVASKTGNPWLAMGAGLACGLILALLSGLFVVLLAADQVVVGTAFNLIALGGTGAIFKSQFGGTGALPSFASLSGRFDPFPWLTVVLAVGLWLLLKQSSWGLVARATGETPKAVESSGFKPALVRLQAMAIGGAMAGLAGAYLSVGIVGSFSENMTNGRGFVAIAMVTFGRWNPLGVLAASLLIGFAESLRLTLQAQGVSAPSQLMIALPYLVALAVLVVAGKSARGPAALGIPLRRDS